MTMLLPVIAVFVALLLVQLVLIGADIRALRYKLLPELLDALSQRGAISSGWSPVVNSVHGEPPAHGEAAKSVGRFIVWEWRGGKWQCGALTETLDPGLTPGYPGAFEGDLAKTWQPVRS
jgi:hypothetical protein